MMGLHPCDVKENYLEELETVEEWLQKEKFVAVGEIGIDLYWDKSTLSIQEDAFRKQVELAKKYKLPIIALGLGEKEDDLQLFSAEKFAEAFTQVN